MDLVIRGEDLVESTGRQIRLGRMLGREEPAVFLHHPLIVKPDGAKLSKAAGDTGVRELRNAGAAPEEVWREAGRRGRVPGEVMACRPARPNLSRPEHRSHPAHRSHPERSRGIYVAVPRTPQRDAMFDPG